MQKIIPLFTSSDLRQGFYRHASPDERQFQAPPAKSKSLSTINYYPSLRAIILLAGICIFALSANAFALSRQQVRFNADWKFHLGDVTGGETAVLNDSVWRILDLPHDWSAEGEFSPTHASCTGFLLGGIGWYRKTFPTESAWFDKKVCVTFDGVYRNAEVWINGHSLGQRPFGYITFQYDLTPYLLKNGNNVLAVRAARENVADSRWYPGSGIYRDVWLTVTSPVHVVLWGDSITTPLADAKSADVVVRTEVMNGTATAQSVRVGWQIVKPDGSMLKELAQNEIIAPKGSFTFSQWQKIAKPELWSPDSPALYTMVSRVFVDDKLTDETRTSFGIRTFYFDANNGFFLNGQNLKIKGLCLHHDGGVVGAAVPDDVLERRLKRVKQIGGNAIRCSHNPMSPVLYDLCDRLGLLVIDEAFDEWEIGKRKWVDGRNHGQAGRFGYSEDFEQWAERDCADMVRRDRNHPSIIMWSIGNEIDYPTDPYVLEETRAVEGFVQDDKQPKQTRLAVVAPKLIAAVKRNDPTRPVTMALANVVSGNATGLVQMLDVVGYNYQEKDYQRDHQAYPTRVIYGSENGRNYQQWTAVVDHSFISGQFLWVGFDFLGEAGEWPNHGSQSGLFDTRGFLKPSAYQRQALWSDVPMVRLTSLAHEENSSRHRPSFVEHWNWPAASKVKVVAFSNCEKVVLKLNGRTLAEQSVAADRTVSFEVAYQPGRLEAVGYRAGNAVTSTTLVTAGPPAALKLELDRKSLPADGRSVAYAIISMVDADGNLVSLARDAVTIEVAGAGRLLGVDNGDMNDPTSLSSHTKKLLDGRLLVLLQAGKISGVLHLTATTDRIASAKIDLSIMPDPLISPENY